MWVSSNLKVCSLLYLHLMARGKKPLSKQPGRGAEILQGMQTRFLLPEHGSISLTPVLVMGQWERAWSTGLLMGLTSD